MNTNNVHPGGTKCSYWTNGVGEIFDGSEFSPTHQTLQHLDYIYMLIKRVRVLLPGQLGPLHQMRGQCTSNESTTFGWEIYLLLSSFSLLMVRVLRM